MAKKKETMSLIPKEKKKRVGKKRKKDLSVPGDVGCAGLEERPVMLGQSVFFQ